VVTCCSLLAFQCPTPNSRDLRELGASTASKRKNVSRVAARYDMGDGLPRTRACSFRFAAHCDRIVCGASRGLLFRHQSRSCGRIGMSFSSGAALEHTGALPVLATAFPERPSRCALVAAVNWPSVIRFPCLAASCVISVRASITSASRSRCLVALPLPALQYWP
jgi:hypothetical protein